MGTDYASVQQFLMEFGIALLVFVPALIFVIIRSRNAPNNRQPQQRNRR